MGAYLCQDALANNFRDNLCASDTENLKGCLTQHKTQLASQAALWLNASYSQKQWNLTRFSEKKEKKKINIHCATSQVGGRPQFPTFPSSLENLADFKVLFIQECV